jgi:hypothetical protein
MASGTAASGFDGEAAGTGAEGSTAFSAGALSALGRFLLKLRG